MAPPPGRVPHVHQLGPHPEADTPRRVLSLVWLLWAGVGDFELWEDVAAPDGETQKRKLRAFLHPLLVLKLPSPLSFLHLSCVYLYTWQQASCYLLRLGAGYFDAASSPSSPSPPSTSPSSSGFVIHAVTPSPLLHHLYEGKQTRAWKTRKNTEAVIEHEQRRSIPIAHLHNRNRRIDKTGLTSTYTGTRSKIDPGLHSHRATLASSKQTTHKKSDHVLTLAPHTFNNCNHDIDQEPSWATQVADRLTESSQHATPSSVANLGTQFRRRNIGTAVERSSPFPE
ncbi:hypothetical protein NM208_g16051 [Fusarium decemcellulare]|uniref:Uncharacterized protein n=1 Tax=Fusarium decemcellulare TaxID=57161 RepID=A0ACC1RD58_9HYPO|nr:hypothetical protein NM208_g16051 [Fusarium decemcellulare]